MVPANINKSFYSCLQSSMPLAITVLRVPAHRIRNAPAVLLDGCYAFIALIILFLGLFY